MTIIPFNKREKPDQVSSSRQIGKLDKLTELNAAINSAHSQGYYIRLLPPDIVVESYVVKDGKLADIQFSYQLSYELELLDGSPVQYFEDQTHDNPLG